MNITALLLALWLFGALALSITGWFERFSSATLFAVCPLISAGVFLILFRFSNGFRDYVRTFSLRRLTRLQALRFFGLLALIKLHQNILPSIFAIPTAVIDVLLAITAFLVAKRLISSKGRPAPGFFVWHIAGIVTFAISATLAILASSSRFGLVGETITTQPMTWFPMSLAPTFIGPLVLLCHLFALFAGHLRRSIPEPRLGGVDLLGCHPIT